MSGHSKWSSIKHKKGAADAKRGKLFSKLSRAIIVAAKEGGPDPAGNLALQNAIEKARSYSMPKDNIERAIARGSGQDADAGAFETIVYEGYGAGGIAVMVEALTDNRNRTASEVRHLLAKNDGNLGETGGVAWLFERRGVVLVTTPLPGAIRHKVYDADYVGAVASGDADLQTSGVVESTQAGTVLIGSSRQRKGFDDTIESKVLKALARRAIALFPMLAGVPVMRAYGGFRPYAPDHLPIIARVELGA